jgi:hypothetical protein
MPIQTKLPEESVEGVVLEVGAGSPEIAIDFGCFLA